MLHDDPRHVAECRIKLLLSFKNRQLQILIHSDLIVTDLVLLDHRTTVVLRKYGINYCCGGNVSLEKACQIADTDIGEVLQELRHLLTPAHVAPGVHPDNWTTGFLIDYIVNVHHAYLVHNMPELVAVLEKFVNSHQSKYPWLTRMMEVIVDLNKELDAQLRHEENIIFPYIRQMAHVHDYGEPGSDLLVDTLHRSTNTVIADEQNRIDHYLAELRELTNYYHPAANACVTHKVALSKLKELDSNLSQHIYLKHEILFTRALQIEKDLKAVYKY